MAAPRKQGSSSPPASSGGGRLSLKDAAKLPATQFGGMRLKGEQGHVGGGVVSKKSMKLGGGGRFEAFVQKLASQGKSPGAARAIAAAQGRKKYGAGQMAKWSAAGRKRK